MTNVLKPYAKILRQLFPQIIPVQSTRTIMAEERKFLKSQGDGNFLACILFRIFNSGNVLGTSKTCERLFFRMFSYLFDLPTT